MEKVSVIVPVYNAENTIDRCLESITKQTYTNLEIICINDGSKDNSYEILKKISQKDSRILVINKENGGVSSARNSGLSRATGKYIAFIDIDDYMEEDMIESLVSRLEKDNSELVICNYKIKQNNYISDNDFDEKNLLMNKKEFLKNFSFYARKVLTNQPWNKLFIKNKITEKFDENINLGEDFIFNINYINNIDKISILNEKKYIYDVSGKNSLTKKNTHSQEDFFDLYYKLYKTLYYDKHLVTSIKLDFWIIKNFIFLINNIYSNRKNEMSRYKYMQSQYKYISNFKNKLDIASKIDIIKKNFIFSNIFFQINILLFCILK